MHTLDGELQVEMGGLLINKIKMGIYDGCANRQQFRIGKGLEHHLGTNSVWIANRYANGHAHFYAYFWQSYTNSMRCLQG